MTYEIIAIVLTAFATLGYCVMGVGTSRAIGKLNGREVNLFEVVFWPILLAVIAAVGDVA